MSEQTATTAPTVVKKAIVIGSDPTPWNIELSERKVRGEAATRPVVNFLDFPLEDDKTDQLIATINRFARAIGQKKFWKAVYRGFIRPAGLESSGDAYDDTTDEFELSVFVKKLVEWFDETTKAGGPKLADINNRMAEISLQLAALVTEIGANPPNEQERLALARLTVELNTLSQAREKKSARVRKMRASKDAKAAAAKK